MIHCSLIDQRLLTMMQNLNPFLETLLIPFSLSSYPSETSSYSPLHHNSVLVAFLGLFQLSLLSSVNPFSILTLEQNL